MPDWTDKLDLREIGEEDGFHGHNEKLADLDADEQPVTTAIAEPAPKAQTTHDASPGRKTTAKSTTARKAASARKR